MIPIQFAIPSFSCGPKDDYEYVYCIPARIGKKQVEVLKVKAEELVTAHNEYCPEPPKVTVKEVCQNHLDRFRAVSRWAHAKGGFAIPLYTEKSGSKTFDVGFVPWNSHCKSMLLSVPELMKTAGEPPMRLPGGAEYYPEKFYQYRMAQYLLSKWAAEEPKWRFAIPHFERRSPSEWITALDKVAVARIKVHLSQLGGAYLKGNNWPLVEKKERKGWTEHARSILQSSQPNPEWAIAMTTLWARSVLLNVAKYRLVLSFVGTQASIVDVDGSEQGVVENLTKDTIRIDACSAPGSLVVDSIEVPPNGIVGIKGAESGSKACHPDGAEVQTGALVLNLTTSEIDVKNVDPQSHTDDAFPRLPIKKNKKFRIQCSEGGTDFSLANVRGLINVILPEGKG